MKTRFTPLALIAATILLAGCAHNKYGYTQQEWAALPPAERAAIVSQREINQRQFASEASRERSASDSQMREQFHRDARTSGIYGPKF